RMNVVNIQERLARDMGEEMEAFDPSVLPDEESIERHAGIFRRAVQHFAEKAAAARRALRIEMKTIARERRDEEARHRKAIAELDEREREARSHYTDAEANARRLGSIYSEALTCAEGV